MWAAVLAGCALAAFSVSLNTGCRGRLAEAAGKPVANAFLLYHYSAGSKSIWPWAHYDGPFLARTDENGRFRIPWRAHLRFPLVTLTSPARLVLAGYVPQLHNYCEISFEPHETQPACARETGEAGERVFQMRDLSGDAVARFRTVWLLLYAAQAPPGQRHELTAATRSEYEQFLTQYGDVVPEMPSETWPLASAKDWTQESTENRPWRFFLQQVPFYGVTMQDKLAQLEKQSP